MPPPMHLLIPFAAPGSHDGLNGLPPLDLPHLTALLATAPAPQRDTGDDTSLSPPHERALARALGLSGADGSLPWAAWLAAQDGVQVQTPPDLCWGLLTPSHWHLGTDQVTMLDPDELSLDETQSQALLHAVHDLFASEGFLLVYGAPTRWYVAHESLAGLATASPDRVIGRNVDPWLPPSRGARLWRRLQNEVQMRLHTHPLNAEREARGQRPVNSVWLSGSGTLQSATWPADLVVDDRLRRPMLAGDAAAWCAAWQALDAQRLAPLRSTAATLTLCGDRCAATWTLSPPRPWQRLAARWRRPDTHRLLETL